MFNFVFHDLLSNFHFIGVISFYPYKGIPSKIIPVVATLNATVGMFTVALTRPLI